MIEAIECRNFKVLRDAKLPLSRFTVIVGPNGSGKSTVFQALQAIKEPRAEDYTKIVSAGLRSPDEEKVVEVILHWGPLYAEVVTTAHWESANVLRLTHLIGSTAPRISREVQAALQNVLAGIQVYSFNASAIAAPVLLKRAIELREDGGHLAGVLDQFWDLQPERFETLNEELGRWVSEFDRILFDTTDQGQREFLLRTRNGHHAIPARDLSQGTLLALAMFTLAYLPTPPSVLCLEEPDRGIHPRLLCDIRDALYQLSYPENYGETRAPVQVIATTHSPYFLDLYRDHPEEVVIASRVGPGAHFERLSDRPDIEQILGEAPLGEVWYSGILGGVPSER